MKNRIGLKGINAYNLQCMVIFNQKSISGLPLAIDS